MAATVPLGAGVEQDGVRFSVWSGTAEAVWVSLFEKHGIVCEEVDRLRLESDGDGVHSILVPGLTEGALYGFRADGPYDPGKGLWFDPAKLLLDPYARAIDWPFRYNALLAAPRWQQVDTAPMMPKAVVTAPPAVRPRPPLFPPDGLIYEINVRGFTRLHPEVPEKMRGTIGALAHPAVIEHLRKLDVGAVELMPITAWIDERHLPVLGLGNAWGYNPVGFMALDPRLAPGGIADLRDTVAALHEAGIGVILDVVFNHTGESDVEGPTLSLRGLDNLAYYRHLPGEPGRLVNDTGTGNTLACDHPVVQRLVLDSLRHFVRHAGIDGFRFDLAPILGRGPAGFERDAPLLRSIVDDPELSDRILVAEPWDIGPGGYQLGNFPPPFLEWNDRYRDDVRRFWRGDAGTLGALATRFAGSSDAFGSATGTRSVNFVAAHDGMTLADLVAYEHKHNEANGEENSDGHGENLSWNNGVEGPSDDPAVVEPRRRDSRALLATLFASRGAIMLTAGDESGRSQQGNNNAYAQDNRITWLDWEGRDRELEDFVAALSTLRRRFPQLMDVSFLSGAENAGGRRDVSWLRPDGGPMTVPDWEDAGNRCLAVVLAGLGNHDPLLGVLVNGTGADVVFTLPDAGIRWQSAMPGQFMRELAGTRFAVEARSVAFVEGAGET